jgi:hypothetical protein
MGCLSMTSGGGKVRRCRLTLSSHIHGGVVLPFRDLSLFLSQLVLDS